MTKDVLLGSDELYAIYRDGYNSGRVAEYSRYEDTDLIETATVDGVTFDNDLLEDELELLRINGADDVDTEGFWNE